MRNRLPSRSNLMMKWLRMKTKTRKASIFLEALAKRATTILLTKMSRANKLLFRSKNPPPSIMPFQILMIMPTSPISQAMNLRRSRRAKRSRLRKLRKQFNLERVQPKMW